MKKFLLVIVIALSITALAGCAAHTTDDGTVKAKVLGLVDETYHDEDAGKYYRSQYLTIRVLEGPFEDSIY